MGDMIADSIRIECDEDGFHMIVETASDGPAGHEGGSWDFGVQGIAVELLREVQSVIGSWYAEGESVREEYMRRGFECSPEDVDESSGQDRKSYTDDQDRDSYTVSDPKYPDYHSIHADLYDNREKGGRCV